MIVEMLGFPFLSEFVGPLYWIEIFSLAVEILAVAIILITVLVTTGSFVVQRLTNQFDPEERFKQYKQGLARALLLSLEILVAADIVRTVALEPSFESVGVLGVLVVIRTFLSWSLVVEIEGRWPWQPKRINE